MKSRFHIIYYSMIFVLFINSCETKKMVVSSLTPSEIEINTLALSETYTNTKKPTYTKEPTKVSTFTLTNTETPTITNPPVDLSLNGPWMVFNTDDGIWAMSNDGTGLRRIIEKPDNYSNYYSSTSQSYIPFMASPKGHRLAFSLIKPMNYSSSTSTPLLNDEPYLFIMSFPDLSIKVITSLYSPSQIQAITNGKTENEITDDEWYQLEQMKSAIMGNRSLAWSSTGKRLAFSAAIDGPSSDVYMLDLDTSTISRLSDGSTTQAVDLSWSPGDRYVVHTAAVHMNCGGGTGACGGGSYDSEGIWIANPNGEEVNKILSGDDYIIRWFTEDEILAGSWEISCPVGSFNMREVNIRTGKDVTIWDGMFEDADIDPKTQSILVGTAISSKELEGLSCPRIIDPGIYLLDPETFLPNRIDNITQDYFTEPLSIRWSTVLNIFMLKTGLGIRFISASGEVSKPAVLEPSKSIELSQFPVISPNGKYWLVDLPDYSGWVVRNQDGKIINVIGPACVIAWRPDSNAFFFTKVDEDEGSIFIAEAPDFTIREVASGLSIDCNALEFQWVK